MSPICTAILASLALGSGTCHLALQDVTQQVMAMPSPPQKPLPVPVPMPPSPPAPAPPVPPPSPTVPDRRCGLDKPHRPHEWTDAAGQTFRCDGAVPPVPRSLR